MRTNTLILNKAFFFIIFPLITYSESIDGSDDGLAAVGDVFPVLEESFLLVLTVGVVLHLLDVGSSSESLLVTW